MLGTTSGVSVSVRVGGGPSESSVSIAQTIVTYRGPCHTYPYPAIPSSTNMEVTSARQIVAFCMCLATAAASSIPATAAIWQGRTLRNEQAGAVAFSWEGVQASFTVSQASSVTMIVSSTFPHGASKFHVLVDKVLHSNVSVVGGSRSVSVQLLSNLDRSTSHVVTLWSITDPIALTWPNLPPASLEIESFSSDGLFLLPPQPKTRRLKIIGDSITAGNQIDKASCQPDHWGTYGAKLCRYFDANCTTLAISGKGLFENCCDNNVTMVELAKRVVVGDASSIFNEDLFVPDAILLNLGTNDQGRNNGTAAWVAGFVAAYADYLVSLAAMHHNPALPIFCGVGSITHDYNDWVVQAMAAAAARGLRSLHLVNYTSVLVGCGHPGWVGHQQMFDVAQPILSMVLGWQ